MIKKNADGSLFVGEIVKDEEFMNPPVIDEETEETEVTEEKPKNKGGRPKKS